MKVLVVLTALVAACSAQYYPYAGYYGGYNAWNAWPYAGYGWNGAAVRTVAAPYAYAARPYAYAAPYAYYGSQHHAQDEFGQYNYGYTDGLSTKNEIRRADGVTVGGYSYVDAEGKTQTISYTAGPQGFQVKGTNLPVAPTADLVQPKMTLVGPEPVEDTPEVQAAKAEFMAAYNEAASRTKRELQAPEPVEDTDEVKAAKAEFKRLYDAHAALAEAAPDTDGPMYYNYPYAYGAYPYAANWAGAYPYSGLWAGAYARPAARFAYSSPLWNHAAWAPYAAHVRVARSAEAPEPVEDTDEVKAAKAEFKRLYDAHAALAEAAPDTDGPMYYNYPYAYGAYPYAASWAGAYPYAGAWNAARRFAYSTNYAAPYWNNWWY